MVPKLTAEQIGLLEDPLNEYPVSSVGGATDDPIDIGADIRPPYAIRQGLRLRNQALKEFFKAWFANLSGDAPRTHLAKAREAISSASYWLEGTEAFTQTHFDIHQIGRFTRINAPALCEISRGEHGFELTCPLAIAHKRFGFSAGMIVSHRSCSLCGEDPSECPHLGNHLYRIRGGKVGSPTGRCRVCGDRECEHKPGTNYITTPVVVVEKVERLDEVSIVDRPTHPDARLASIPIGSQGLLEHFGFSSGNPSITVRCDRCIQVCRGLTYLSGGVVDRSTES